MVFTTSPNRRLGVQASFRLGRLLRHARRSYGVASRAKASGGRHTEDKAVARGKSRAYTPARAAASLQRGKGERAEEREKRGEGGENRANLEFGGATPASSSPSARPPILLRPSARPPLLWPSPSAPVVRQSAD